jgi:class 3 adenylate cyclase
LEGLGLAQYGDRFEAELRGAPPSPVASDRMAATPTPAKHLPDKILHSKSALEVERKQVTVLFADMKGSMELAEQMYPEAWSAIMQPFFTILAEGVERFEGLSTSSPATAS